MKTGIKRKCVGEDAYEKALRLERVKRNAW
jgi:hypothetical protein